MNVKIFVNSILCSDQLTKYHQSNIPGTFLLCLFPYTRLLVKTLPQTNYSSYLQVESIFLICQDTLRDKQDIFFLLVNLIAYVLLLCDCTFNSGQLWLQK